MNLCDKIKKNIIEKTFWQKIKNKLYFMVVAPIIKRLLSFAPMKKNKIVLDNFIGRGFGEDPKYIALEILNQHKDWDLVWLVNDTSMVLPEGIRGVKYGSIKAFWELATASIWVDNVRNTMRVRKKRKQIYLQTWHGGFPIKKIEQEIENDLDSKYISAAKKDGKICDAILVENSFIEQIFLSSFWLNSQVELLRVGIPRNDIFFDDDFIKEAQKKVKKFFELRGDEYIVLYAPTFRDDYSYKGYLLDFEKICDTFTQRYNKETRIIIKLHPNARDLQQKINYSNRILNGTDYQDIQELYCIADSLISDYSSTALEYSAFLKKPAYTCTIDYYEYIKKRDLRAIFDEFPFPHSFSSEELIKQINEFNNDEYEKNRSSFFEKYRIYDSGDAAKQIVHWMDLKMNNDNK